jgi:O-antigen ligase
VGRPAGGSGGSLIGVRPQPGQRAGPGAGRAPWRGALVLAPAACWPFVAARASGGRAWEEATLVAATAVALATAGAVARRWPAAVPALVVVVAAVLAGAAGRRVADPAPLGGPFGYVNATGAFFFLASAAGVGLAASARRPAVRVGGAVAALGFAFVPVAARTAAAVLVVPLPAIALLLGQTRPRLAVAVLGAGLVAVVGVTAALGATASGAVRGCDVPAHCPASVGRFHREAARLLGGERLALWRDAVRAAARHPVFGVGPGRFAAASPTAADPDLRHGHSLFLERAAEEGLPGLATLLAPFAWAFARLARRATPAALVAAGTLAGAGALGAIDYVFRFPALPLALAALVGAGLAAPGRAGSERRSS